MYRPMTDRVESAIYPDTQSNSGGNGAFMTADKMAYLTLDFNTYNHPLDLDYLFDVTTFRPNTDTTTDADI